MKLEKKVHAVNEVQRIAKLNYKHVLPILESFIGKQIVLKSGDKSAALKKTISFLDEQPKGFGNDYARLHCAYLNIVNNSIWLNISCSFKDTETNCFYEEANIFIGTIEDGILTKINYNYPMDKYYDLEEIRSLLNRKKELKKELDKIKSKTHKFTNL
ncbi:MAG: hypothetical protein U9Q27_01465 [Patescibacteria group bacterium]|nr:hypothetical protein [Patescibacteria group bacterium]